MPRTVTARLDVSVNRDYTFTHQSNRSNATRLALFLRTMRARLSHGLAIAHRHDRKYGISPLSAPQIVNFNRMTYATFTRNTFLMYRFLNTSYKGEKLKHRKRTITAETIA